MKETPFTLEGSHRHAQARAVDNIGSGLVPQALGVRRAARCRASEQLAHLTCSQQVSSVTALRMKRRLRQFRVRRQVAALRSSRSTLA
jgi:3-methyladenine DNA glycosylase/8-oxoguanine DNA glycosylase